MPPSPADQVKTRLRRRLRRELAALPQAQRQNESQANAVVLLTILEQEQWPDLAAYLAMTHECDTGPLVERYLDLGRPVWLPRMLPDHSLTWHAVTCLDQVVPGVAGILEPRPDLIPAADLPEGCRVVVPGLAFTAAGQRLGQGGGCYDRVLVRKDLRSLGYAFSMQVLPELPLESHDRSVQAVLAGGVLMDTSCSGTAEV